MVNDALSKALSAQYRGADQEMAELGIEPNFWADKPVAKNSTKIETY